MDKALAIQLANIEKRTGKTLDELKGLVHSCGLQKHGEIRDYLKRELGMGHGDANTLVHVALQSDAAAAAAGRDADGVLAAIYSGPKAALRPLHDRVMEEIGRFGPFEVAPKKGYVSLRRAKQFAMVGPATNTKLEVGLNLKGAAPPARFTVVPPGGMCQLKLRLDDLKEVDAELVEWLRKAYDAAG